MKRKGSCIIALLCVVAWGAVACAAAPKDYLLYQDYPFRIEAEVENASLTAAAAIEMKSSGVGIVRFTAPETLCGYAFEASETGVLVRYGETVVPLEGDFRGIAEKIVRALSLGKESFAGAEVPQKGGFSNIMTVNIARFVMEDGTADVYIRSDNGEPLRIEAELDGEPFTLQIQAFEKIGENTITTEKREEEETQR